MLARNLVQLFLAPAVLLFVGAGARWSLPGGGAQPAVGVTPLKLARGLAGLGLGPTAPLSTDRFGYALGAIGDLDGNGVGDLAVSGPYRIFESESQGAVWVLLLRADGMVQSFRLIDGGAPQLALDAGDVFGFGLAGIGDLDGDGNEDLAVGAPGDDDGGSDAGAVWIVFLNADGTGKGAKKIASGQNGFGGALAAGDQFGDSVAAIGDLDGDGIGDLAVGAPGVDAGGTNAGAVWILNLLADGSVKSERRIDGTSSGLAGAIDSFDRFGDGVSELGDLDGDGLVDIAVGAPVDELSGRGNGAVFVLFLNADGSVRENRPITFGMGGFVEDGFALGAFGAGLSCLGDLDGNGLPELGVGDPLNPEGAGPGATRGAVWRLTLAADGSVLGQQKLNATTGGLAGVLSDDGQFGRDLAPLGDLDMNGMGELAVGAPFDPEAGPAAGAVFSLFTSIGASVASRNGGTNPASLSADAPVLGGTWNVTVDLTTTGHAFAQILGYASSLELVLPGGQTLLMNVLDPSGEQLAQPLVNGPQAHFALPVPNDPAFAGLCLTVQAVHALGVSPFALSNALEIVVGY